MALCRLEHVDFKSGRWTNYAGCPNGMLKPLDGQRRGFVQGRADYRNRVLHALVVGDGHGAASRARRRGRLACSLFIRQSDSRAASADGRLRGGTERRSLALADLGECSL